MIDLNITYSPKSGNTAERGALCLNHAAFPVVAAVLFGINHGDFQHYLIGIFGGIPMAEGIVELIMSDYRFKVCIDWYKKVR